MKTIILDTNFLLIPATHNLDIFAEIDRIMKEPYELCIMKETVKELERIVKEQPGKSSDSAKIALKLINIRGIKQKSLNMAGHSMSVDEEIVYTANADTIVATQDRELKEKLTNKGIQLIILRGKKHLELN
jgi:rRNA-processing protein FCF1